EGDFAERSAGVTRDSTRHIDSDDAVLVFGRVQGEASRFAFERPRQAGAEQRVDKQIGHAIAVSDRHRLAAPAPRHLGSITLVGAEIAKGLDPDRPAAIAEIPRRDQTIAAVVAGTAEDADRSRRP